MRKIIGPTAVLLACAGMALAAPDVPKGSDYGKYQYEGNCASCHGLGGKGDGHLKSVLTRSPTDLTILSKSNGGAFPTSHVWRAIDGRLDVRSHGRRDMPVWGRDFMGDASPGTDTPFHTEKAVQARIFALIDYIKRLQVE